MSRYRIAAVFILLMLVVSCPFASADRITAFEMTAATQGSDAAWKLLRPDRNDGFTYYEADCAELRIWSKDGPTVPTISNRPDVPLLVSEYTVMMREVRGVDFTISQIDEFYYAADDGVFIHSQKVPLDLPIQIPAFGEFKYRGGSPHFNPDHLVVVVSGTDKNGHDLEFYGLIEHLNLSAEETVSVENKAYDIGNLRHDADYEIEVAEGVWWVPASSIGKSDYTNQQIAEMLNEKPESKQEKIDTLYEALQLYELGDFYSSDDNVRIREGKYDWEHHKPGYDAVRTNNGCCASNSNWLNYILRGDYEQVGFLAYSQADGSGHIINYIYTDGAYYFIDLTHYRSDFLSSGSKETGSLANYRNSDYVAGNLHKARTPEDYVRYCVASFNDPPELFFLYQAEECMPVCSVENDDRVAIVYPDSIANRIKVIPRNDSPQIDFIFANDPKRKNNWNKLPAHKFTANQLYLADEEDVPQLTGYKAGDILDLTDYGESSGLAMIDGIMYQSCRDNRTVFAFEGDVPRYGGGHYSYYSYSFPPEIRDDRIRDMRSIVIGTVSAEFSADVEDKEIIIGEQRGDKLYVTEVDRNKQFISRQVCLYRGEDGGFRDSPIYWYLMIHKEGEETVYRFGRLLIEAQEECSD